MHGMTVKKKILLCYSVTQYPKYGNSLNTAKFYSV